MIELTEEQQAQQRAITILAEAIDKALGNYATTDDVLNLRASTGILRLAAGAALNVILAHNRAPEVAELNGHKPAKRKKKERAGRHECPTCHLPFVTHQSLAIHHTRKHGKPISEPIS